MSEWTARITDHRVWKVMEGLGPKIDEAENVEGIEHSAVESLERLRAVLTFCGKRLGATDPLTMTLAPLDAIATSFQTATTEVESFIKDKNFDHLTAANASGADQALGYLAQVPGIATKQELVGLVQAANESRKAFEQHAKKSSESLKKAEGEIGELRKALESTQSLITTLQGQIDTERQKITPPPRVREDQLVAADLVAAPDRRSELVERVDFAAADFDLRLPNRRPGLLLGLALIASASLGLGRRALYGAIAVILAVTTAYIYFHADQELAATLSGPRDELQVGAFAIQMWLKACRIFGLATIGGLLATILFQVKRPTDSASAV